jgi:RecA/RadA recombinase
LFYHDRVPTPSAEVTAALATLRSRWGAAAPRTIGEAQEPPTIGALAAVPLPEEHVPEPAQRPFDDRPPERTLDLDDGRIVSTGFAALDAILGPGGLPRLASVAMHGDASSGKTTLALRLAAEAQAGGAIVAWLDLARSFDPVEAVARGVRLEWLVVLTPESLDEGLSIAGALLQGRAVDLLLVDLPATLRTDEVRPKRASGTTRRPPGLADRLHRLAALARRAGCLLVVLEPPGLPSAVSGALGESVGLRLELARRAWIRLGRDVVGQRTEVVVARNHFGPPGRRADLRILYADGGSRDDCLAVDPLLAEAGATSSVLHVLAARTTSDAPDSPRIRQHATAPPLLATSPAPPGASALGGRELRIVPEPDPPGPAVPERARRPRRATLGRRRGARHEPAGVRTGHPPRDAARRGASPVAGGVVPRS